MSIGFTFTGRVKKPETLLVAAQKLAEERATASTSGRTG